MKVETSTESLYYLPIPATLNKCKQDYKETEGRKKLFSSVMLICYE